MLQGNMAAIRFWCIIKSKNRHSFVSFP